MPPDILEKMTIDDSRWRHQLRRPRRLACGFVALAFVLRAAAAFLGPAHFWVYTDYFEMAKNVVHGVGYCLGDDGTLCAYFPPVYPTIVAAGALTSHPMPVIVLISALLGAGTVWLTYLIGGRLFGTTVGLLGIGHTRLCTHTMSGTIRCCRKTLRSRLWSRALFICCCGPAGPARRGSP